MKGCVSVPTLGISPKHCIHQNMLWLEEVLRMTTAAVQRCVLGEYNNNKAFMYCTLLKMEVVVGRYN